MYYVCGRSKRITFRIHDAMVLYIVDQNRHSMLFKVTRLPGHTHSTRIAQGHPQTLALAPALALLNDLHDIVAAREKSLGEEANDDVLEARPSHSQRTSSWGGSADTHPIAFPRSCRHIGLTDEETVATYRDCQTPGLCAHAIQNTLRRYIVAA